MKIKKLLWYGAIVIIVLIIWATVTNSYLASHSTSQAS